MKDWNKDRYSIEIGILSNDRSWRSMEVEVDARDLESAKNKAISKVENFLTDSEMHVTYAFTVIDWRILS